MEILIFFLLVSPFIIYAVFSEIRSEKKEPTTLNVYLKEPELPKSEKDLMKAIRLRAMQDAALGDKSARDWVTKNIKPEVKESLTSQKVINETVAGLKTLGYTAADAKEKVLSYASKKKYTSTEKLLTDCITNG